MRAAQFYGKEDVRIEQVPERDCGPGQVKIAPAFCGICGTDLHEWAGGPTFAPSPENPHKITGESVPVGFGHEFSGTILEVGSDVKEFKQGQKCVVNPLIVCGECPGCQVGAPMTCNKVGFVGLTGGGGGLAETVVVAQHSVVAIPDDMPLDHGALVEPLAVGWHAVEASNIRNGNDVVILGAGPIGLAALQAAKAQTSGTVIVAEVSSSRQKFAKTFGADHVINPAKEDVPTRVEEILGGKFPQIVLDAAGVPASVETACKIVAPRGSIINIAIWEQPVPFNPNALVFKEATYKGILAYTREDFVRVIEQMSTGAITPASMITRRIRLEDLVEDGIKELIKNKDSHVKILVDLKQ